MTLPRYTLLLFVTAAGCTKDPMSSSAPDAGASDTPDAPSQPGSPTLPTAIDGVEPEAHSHHPPMADSLGNLYRVVETPAAEGNCPKMMSSADGGATWSEVDGANRPTARDLEGGWQLQLGASIFTSFSRGQDVWVQEFRTSDATTSPDRWVDEVRVDTGMSSSGMKQYSSLAGTSDQLWLFYSDSLDGSRQQIAYRGRSNGAWGSKTAIDPTSGSWTSPVPITGKDEVTHLFYKDHGNHWLVYRTLSAMGVLSAAVRIDTSGTSTQVTPMTNAVYFDDNGTEVIVIAFATGTGELKTITIRGGVVGPEETLSPTPVLENPGITANEGTVAHLATDGTTVHAVWADQASGDILHSMRPLGAAWSSARTVWNSGPDEAHWVYAQVYNRNGAQLGFTFDIGPHEDDLGNIHFSRLPL